MYKLLSSNTHILPINQLQIHSTSLIEECLESLLVAIADGDIGLIKYDTPAVDDAYFVFLDDERTMYTHKAGGGKQLFHGLHAHK